MLSGDDGIIINAQKAKEENEKAEIIEQIKLDIADKQIENLGSINEDEFYEILGKYGTVSADETILTTTKGNYDILITDIYSGNIEKLHINLSCDTLDVKIENNVIYTNSTSSDVSNNVILTDTDELEFSIDSTTNYMRYLVIAKNEDYAVGINLNQGDATYFGYVFKFNDSTATSPYNLNKTTIPSKTVSRWQVIREGNTITLNYLIDGSWYQYFKVDVNNIYTDFECDSVIGFIFDGTKLPNPRVLIYDTNSKWYTKKASFFGDSITAENGSYVEYLKTLLGLETAYNCGVAGTSISGTDDDAFVNRYGNYSNEFSDSDLIFIFGGTNDFGQNAALGNIENTSSDTTTFYGALKNLCENLSDLYPQAEIVFATPIYRNDYNGIKLSNYCQAIKDVCNEYNIKCLDLYNESGITADNKDKYLRDGVHPTPEGYAMLAENIARLLNNI